jgi:hypothetical protein
VAATSLDREPGVRMEWWRSTRWIAWLVVLCLVSASCGDDETTAAPDPGPGPDMSIDEESEPEETYELPDEDRSGDAESGRIVFHGMGSSRHLQAVSSAGGDASVVEIDGFDGVGAPAVAPDGERVAALAWAPGAVEVATTLLVGTIDDGLEPILHDDDLDMWCVRWYPSGDRLLLTAFVDDEMSPALLSVGLDGSTTSVEVPAGRFDCAVPLDDERVALTYLGMDIALMGLAVVDTATGDAAVLFEKVGCLLYGGALSPDGFELVIAAACEEPADSGLHVIEVTTGQVEHVLVGELGFPAWSPTGEWLTMGAYATPSAASSTVWIVRRDGTGARRLNAEPGIQPSWVR